MPPNLAQVLNILAHEIRTPLAVAQGYVKLYLDGRLTAADDSRKAFEQTRQALGALATLCVDMGKVGALSENSTSGVPERVTAADFVASLRAATELIDASWEGGPVPGAIEMGHRRDLVQAVAIVSKAAFDEARGAPRVVKTVVTTNGTNELLVLAGGKDSLALLEAGPGAPQARPVDFVRGGKGLKLIWAAFVLNTHRVQTWTHADHRASVGLRIPMVPA